MSLVVLIRRAHPGELFFSACATNDGIFFMIGADQSVIDEGSLMEFAIDSSSKVP